MKKFLILISMLSISFFNFGNECVTSKWGPNDQIGSANLISNQNTLEALKLVKQGKSHGLGVVIEPGMPAFPPRYTQLQVVQPDQHFGRVAIGDYGWDMSANDDVLQMWLGTGSQIDSLGHLGESQEFYNCTPGKEFAFINGMTKFGIEKIPPLVGRGVLLDMTSLKNVKFMKGGEPISVDDIKRAAKKQNIKFKDGDIIIFHTGWTEAKLKQNPQEWVSTEPGITNDAARYLASLNPMAVGSDTWGVGAVPPIEGDKVFYDHVTLIKENGIYILETMNTGRLASEGVSEFLFVLGQAKLKGAVQMIINPVALW